MAKYLNPAQKAAQTSFVMVSPVVDLPLRARPEISLQQPREVQSPRSVGLALLLEVDEEAVEDVRIISETELVETELVEKLPLGTALEVLMTLEVLIVAAEEDVLALPPRR